MRKKTKAMKPTDVKIVAVDKNLDSRTSGSKFTNSIYLLIILEGQMSYVKNDHTMSHRLLKYNKRNRLFFNIDSDSHHATKTSMRNIPQQSKEKKGFVIGAATSNQTIAKITVKKPTERKLSSSPAPSYIRLLPNNFKQKLFNFTPIETSLFRKLIDNKIVPLQNNTVNPRLLQQMRGFEEMTAKPKTSVQIKSLCNQLSLYMPKLDEFSVQKKTNRDEHLLSQNASESRRRLNMSPRVEKIVYRTNLNMGGRGSRDPPKFSLDCERLTPSKGYLFPKGQSNPSLASYRDELTHNYNFSS